MRLKRIDMAGFKSFVDPTRIEFGDGITAVVGPNGCGKSNIIDAVRWVLGEHSARQLRGGVMDDMIFQGSDTRPPVALCDVELTFAIRLGQLSHPYHEAEEISVRRRLNRELGSDAYINGKMVRLKDIIDLFLDTGISSHAYAVIEQGSIARMVTAKPEERRFMLEEAAGIMKYRSRRRESERKMNTTRQNLDRAMDLLGEVRSQCRSLRQQASRAERFKTLQEDWQNFKSISLGLRYQQMKKDCSCIEQELEQARVAEAEAGRLQTGIEHQLDEKRRAMIRYEEDVQDAQDAVRTAELHQAEIQRQIEQSQGKYRLLTERKKHLEQRLVENRERTDQFDEELLHLNNRLHKDDLTTLERELEEMETAVAAALTEHRQQGIVRDQALAKYERLKNEQRSVTERHKFAQSALNRLALRNEAIVAQLKQMELQAEALRTRLNQGESAAKQADKDCTQAESRYSLKQATLEESRIHRAAMEAQLAEKRGQARQLSGDVYELSARLSSGNIDEKLRQTLRSRGLLWVDEEIQVPQGFEHAVAAALRGQSGDALWPDAVSFEAIQELKEKIADAPVAVFMESPGTVTTNLAETLALDTQHPLWKLFSGVAVVDDISDAPDLMQQQAQCYSVVSKDGWLLGRDGWLTPPSRQQTAHKLELKRRLQILEKKSSEADAQAEKSGHDFEQAEQVLQQQQRELEETQLTAIQARSLLASTEEDLKRLQSAASDLHASQLRLQTEQAELAEEEKRAQETLANPGVTDPEILRTAEQALESQTLVWQEAEQTLERSRSELSAAGQKLALRRQAADSIQEDIQRIQQEQETLCHQLSGDNQRLHQITEELAQAEDRKTLDRALSEAADMVNAVYLTLNEKRQAGGKLQQELWDIEQSQRKAQHQSNQATMARKQIQIRLTAEQTRLEDLVAEVLRECHVEAESLAGRLDAMEDLPEAQEIIEKVQKLEDRLSRFGPVNLLAIEEFRLSSEREEFLAAQSADLEASLQTLADTISRIDRTTKRRFQQAFERTNAIFKETFPRLFGGGRAELKLSSDDPLSAGVDIVAQPPGKRLQDIGLLSGGEKALTAVALVFSIFRMKPAPFCILDEVDAPLDDSNVGRFGELMRELASDVQFINVTHNKVSMQSADHLIGVSMPEPGVSKIVGVELNS